MARLQKYVGKPSRIWCLLPTLVAFCLTSGEASDYCTGLCYPAKYTEPTMTNMSLCGLGKYNQELNVTICNAKCGLDGAPVGVWEDGQGCEFNEEPTQVDCVDTSEDTEAHEIYSYDTACDIVNGVSTTCPCNIVAVLAGTEEVVDCYTTECEDEDD